MELTVSELAMAAKNDNSLMENLWLAVERLVGSWAHKYSLKVGMCLCDVDDLKQSGYLALHQAVQTFNPEVAKFTTHLSYYVKNHFAECAGLRGRMRPERYAISLDSPIVDGANETRGDLLPDPGAAVAFSNAEERIFCEQLAKALETCLQTLSAEYNSLLRERYFNNKPLNLVAKKRGISIYAAQQMEKSALRLLCHGKNFGRLKAFRESVLSRAYKNTGFASFCNSGSSVELLTEKLLEWNEGDKMEDYS